MAHSITMRLVYCLSIFLLAVSPSFAASAAGKASPTRIPQFAPEVNRQAAELVGLLRAPIGSVHPTPSPESPNVVRVAAAQALEGALSHPQAMLRLGQILDETAPQAGQLGGNAVFQLVALAHSRPELMHTLFKQLRKTREPLAVSFDVLFDGAEFGRDPETGMPLPIELTSRASQAPVEFMKPSNASVEAGLRLAASRHQAITTLAQNAITRPQDQIKIHQALTGFAQNDLATGLQTRESLAVDAFEGRFADGRDVLAIDIDHFGAFNAALGPTRTDRILTRYGNILWAFARTLAYGSETSHMPSEAPEALRSLRISRHGGEEIVILVQRGLGERLAGVLRAHQQRYFLDLLIADQLIKKSEIPLIKKAMRDRGAGNDAPIATVSIGLATLPATHEASQMSHYDAFATAVDTAFEALHAAKHAGRNRVVRQENGASREIAPPDTIPPLKFQRGISNRTSPTGMAFITNKALEHLPDGLQPFMRDLMIYDSLAPSILSRKGLILEARHILAQHDTAAVIEITGFKDVNDVLGHPAGDFVLGRYGEMMADLRARLGLDITIARRFGKEFVVTGLAADVQQFLGALNSIDLAGAGVPPEGLKSVQNSYRERKAGTSSPSQAGDLRFVTGSLKSKTRMLGPAYKLEKRLDELRKELDS